jgi:hypothetical protein
LVWQNASTPDRANKPEERPRRQQQILSEQKMKPVYPSQHQSHLGSANCLQTGSQQGKKEKERKKKKKKKKNNSKTNS